MGCIFSMIFFPFYLAYYLFIVFVKLIVIVVGCIISFIIALFRSKNNSGDRYNRTYRNSTYECNNYEILEKKENKKKKVLDYKDEKFEREADLWGLSKEDRRIAKEEGMSPAEFVEAEERDDDELFTDEWE